MSKKALPDGGAGKRGLGQIDLQEARSGGEAEEDFRTLSDSLSEQLSEAIVRGEFPTGAKLSEPRLAGRYGVRRGPLRDGELAELLMRRHIAAASMALEECG